MTSIYRALAGSTTPNAISKGVSKSRVTPDSYHPTLSLRDNLIVCFHLGQHNSSAYTSSLLHSYRNFRYLHGSLTPTQKFRISPRVSYQKFRISPRVSYTHTEISDFSTGLLHPHRNLGRLPGSLTPTQKFEISPRVSYIHTEIRDISPGLLHPHKNSGYLPRSLTPTQDLSDTTADLLTLTPSFSP